MRIFVQTITKDPLALDVQPGDSIASVKSTIQTQEGIPVYQQRLFLGAMELEDEWTLSNLEVQSDSCLKLLVRLPSHVPVQVKFSPEKTVTVYVEPTDTIGLLKTKIQAREGTPSDLQRLILAGSLLEDDAQNVHACGIEKDATLHMQVFGAGEAHCMQIFVKTPRGGTLSLDAAPTDAVADLKAYIQRRLDIRPAQQRLLFGGKELEAGVLMDFGVEDQSTLHLDTFFARSPSRAMSVRVRTPAGEEVALGVESEERVEAVKRRLEERTGVPADRQLLVFNGSELQDGWALADYGVGDDSSLVLFRRMGVNIPIVVRTPSGRAVGLEVESTDTIGNVKMMIQSIEDIPRDQQSLVFDCCDLRDGDTLDACHIPSGASLTLGVAHDRSLPAAVELCVELPGGRSIAVDAEPTDTVGRVKARIRAAEGIPEDRQCLLLDEAELEDGRTLADAGVGAQATLHLELLAVVDAPIPALDPAPPNGPDVFISYQWDHQPVVKGLHSRLSGLGYTCWLDISKLGGGHELYQMIERGLRACSVVIACVTPKYSESDNCRREVAVAVSLKRKIIPLMLEETKWPPEGMAMALADLLYIHFHTSPEEQRSWEGPRTDELKQQLENFGVPRRR